MPKFRDLGINTIPVTMRPPAIGDGAAGGKKDDYGDTEMCDPETCVGEEEEDTEVCDPETCVTKDKDKDKDSKNASAFSPEVANQLRQQLDLEIGT